LGCPLDPRTKAQILPVPAPSPLEAKGKAMTVTMEETAANMNAAADAFAQIAATPLDEIDLDKLPESVRRVIQRQRDDIAPIVASFQSGPFGGR
jgi:hypothetical protein